jgi:class 3 adenylate cyclase/tetratricopeptide (TPR) repeat protein
VLFADIVGSTELIVGLDAEAAQERLEPIVRAMVRAVRRFNGTVLRTLGDGLKAGFGVPNAQEGHALLACRAALAMQDAVAALPGAASIRIGVHSGEVVSGTMDTGSAIERDAQGMTVHLASRIEQAADAGSIYVSRECWTLVAAYCDAVSVGALELRGIPHLVETYRLTGLKPAINSDHFRVEGLTRLRGREAELEVLRKAVLDAGDGATGVIGIAAEAGAGKSRLCFEFGEWCRGRRIQVLEARAHMFGQATPMLPILEMLRTFLRVAPGMEPAMARRKISERLSALGPSFADGLPILADFLNVSDPQLMSPMLDPRTRQARLRDVVGRMIKAAGQRTSVLVVEDMHWLDEASQEFMETLVEAVRGTNIVLVMTFRPPWSARWMERTEYREIRLPDLEQSDMRELVRELVGHAPALGQIVADVAAQSDGNPFYAQELVLSLAEQGVLVGGRGRYDLAPSGWHNPVLPATVEAVIGARIDHLTERQKEVLQIGAVIGKEFPLTVVRDVAGIAEAGLQPLLNRLCAAEIIQPCTTDAGASFAFRHPLIQEVAYAMQLRSRRTPLHEAVANAIKRFDWGMRDEAAGLLAHHYEAAGQGLEAATHLQRSARWVGRTNSTRAMADWKKVRRMLDGQSESEARDQLRALANGQLLNFGWREGMAGEEARLYAEEALIYARKVGDRKHEANLLAGYGRVVAATGAADDYVRLVREALALTDPETNPEGILLLNGMLCHACYLAGLLDEALAANDAAIAALDAEESAGGNGVLVQNVGKWVGFDVEYWIRCQRLRPLVFLGQFDEVESLLTRVLQIDPSKADPFHQFIPHAVAVEMAWHRGDEAMARRHVNEGGRYASLSGMPYVLVALRGCHGLTACIDGDFSTAERHFGEALAAAREGRAGLEFEAKLLAYLAETHYRAGDRMRAVQVAREAITVARARTDRLSECQASIVAATALLSDDEPERRQEAEALLGRAESLLYATGAKIFVPMLRGAREMIDMRPQ